MPSFTYTTLSKDGQRTRGVCESADVQAAAAHLRSRQLYVLEIRPRSPRAGAALGGWVVRAASRITAGMGRPVGNGDRVQFLRQMCLMLRSGLPLLQALEVVADQCPRARLARAVRQAADRIQSGASLSAALGQQRGLLPPLALKMVAVGETTGELDILLERMADHLEQRADLRGTILTSLTYPALLVLATVGVVAFLVIQVIPKFAHLLASRNLDMPAMTQWMVNLADFLRAHGVALLVSLAATAVALLLLSLIPRVRYGMDRGLLAVPVVGGLVRLTFLTHFARTLAILLRSGVPILDGLKILSESIGNRALAHRVDRAAEEVLLGKALSEGLRTRIIPPLLPEVITVGEVSGTLDRVLDELAVFYESQLRKRVKWMTTLFEPALILVVGGIVGYVYIAFFTVLYRVSTAHP